MNTSVNANSPKRRASGKLETRLLIFDAQEIARPGVFLTLDRYGELAVYRGHVRPEAETREGADVHSGGRSEADGQGSDATISGADHIDGSEGTESINAAILTEIYADALGRRSADFRAV